MHQMQWPTTVQHNGKQPESHNAESNGQLKIVTNLPIEQPAFGATTKQTLHFTMLNCLSAHTKCKKKFEDQRASTQHHSKSTICKVHEMPSVSFDLASDDAPAPTAKRRSEMAKPNTWKGNSPPIGTEPSRNTTGDLKNADATLDQISAHNSNSEVNFEPSMLNNEGDDVKTAWVAASQPVRSNEPLAFLL